MKCVRSKSLIVGVVSEHFYVLIMREIVESDHTDHWKVIILSSLMYHSSSIQVHLSDCHQYYLVSLYL